MKKLHIEFDLIATDRTAEELISLPDVCLMDNILDALEARDECENIENFKIERRMDKEKCPHCGSTDTEVIYFNIVPGKIIRECKICKKEFISL